MERLFSPYTRYRDTLVGEISERHLLRELNLDVSTAELLTAERAFTYADLYDMLGDEENSVAWFTPRTCVMREWKMARVYTIAIDGAC
jgi:hypothetical protein